jgi:hypothetical protein
MGRIKAYYHDELQMNDAEIETYLELLHAEYVMKHEAYAYEDNYKPFETTPLTQKPNNVRCEGG